MSRFKDDEEVFIRTGSVTVPGNLTIPSHPKGVVVFAHGSGSSRLSPRNRQVAQTLNDAGIATLLFDLLTPSEERDRRNVFNVRLLSSRLVDAVRWVENRTGTSELPLGLFGASTGAAAALVAATEPGLNVRAVVSRGGRPDLAGRALLSIDAPTLLIVGGEDHAVLELNRLASSAIPAECRLAVVTGATHVFEEPGTLDEAARLARDWFLDRLHPTPSEVTPSQAARP